jgi:prolyl oligopeptidase
MKKLFFPVCFLFFMHLQAQIKYPTTKKDSQMDDYFGKKIEDPYRWLEDDNSKETGEWVIQQNELTNSYLSKIPYREQIKKRLTDLSNFERFSTPFKKGDLYFYYSNSGTQNQNVFNVLKELNGTPEVLIDPNTFSKDGTVALGSISISKDGKYLAYEVSKAGSDWAEIRVMEIASKKLLKDELKWIKFSGMAFKGDGFYYSRYDEPAAGKELSKKNEFHKVYYHKIGEAQSLDKLIFEDKEHALRNFGAQVTEDENYLLIYGSESTSGNSLSIMDLTKPDSKFINVVTNFENDYSVIDNFGNSLLVYTNYKAPNYQLISIDANNPKEEAWNIVVGQAQDLLKGVQTAGNFILCNYLVDVQSKILKYDRKGKLIGNVSLPGIGIVDEINSEKNKNEVFFSFTNFTTPVSAYKYDAEKDSRELYKESKVPFNANDYETKQVFYKSKDGNSIPMFLVYKKGLILDGNNPCFLYGYGGFNISVTPSFSATRMVFLENGGIYAVANIRGGGEYGENWHNAGTVFNKQNVFDDFIGAADYLKKEKYTTTEKLAIHGRSNGGLLIGAVMTQRPDISKVALPGVGVLDMLRYHKFTIGWAWATDYGTSDNEKEFINLLKYSPLHNVKKVAYPATMIVTGDHDDRVVPAHSFKFAATLQENQVGNNPILTRIDINAGHGAGKPLAKTIDEWGDIWSFVFYNLGMNFKQ